jgi:hypothetical protein
MRHLVQKADIITPNYTEACFLTETEYRPTDKMSRAEIESLADELLCKLLKYGKKSIAVTGFEDASSVITFGIDEYVLEYSLSGHFSRMEGDIEQTFSSELGHIERIYIPVYVQTSSAHRVIGHVVLKKTGDGYSHTPGFFKGTSDGSYVHFLECAGTLDAVKAKCAEHGLTDVTDVILVNLLDEWRDAAARISVVQTPDGRYVLDYGNAAYVEGAESSVYTFEEFSKIYSAYEKTRFPIETAGEIAEIVETTIDAVEWIMIVAAIAAGIAVFIGIGYHMHRKKRK